MLQSQNSLSKCSKLAIFPSQKALSGRKALGQNKCYLFVEDP